MRDNRKPVWRVDEGIMAKAFSTAKLLKGKEPFLRRLVCEVRFQDGQLVSGPYWQATEEADSRSFLGH